jgi:hypothetical protein
MPGYIKKKLQEYNHVKTTNKQSCPYTLPPKQFGSEAQRPLPTDISPLLDKKGIKCIQQFVRSILYFARAVDMTVLMAFSRLAIDQTKAATKTMVKCVQLLDYLAYHADAKVRFYASDIIMNIHLDASYYPKAKPAVELVGTSSWDGSPKTGSPFQSMVLFMLAQMLSVSSLCPRQKPNLAHYSIIVKLKSFF